MVFYEGKKERKIRFYDLIFEESRKYGMSKTPFEKFVV